MARRGWEPRAGSPETEAILRAALRRIRPEEAKLQEVEAFVTGLNRKLKRLGLAAEAMLGGSTAKGTFLKGDHDVDVFVRFDLREYGDRSGQLSALLEPALPKRAERIHGSRDYFQLRRKGFLFEIVPVLRVSRPEEAQNVTDMSPLHVAHVLAALRRAPLLADEIRLAKQFCKSAKAYGAESYINGFSGHVLDLLILRYGSFLGLLTAASRWGDRTVLDPGRHHRSPAFALDPAKVQGPMILVDPVQPQRNAAAALSQEKYARFTEAARAFLEKPAKAFFTVTPLTAAQIRKEYAKRKQEFSVPTRLLILESEPLEGKEDIVVTKLLTLHRHLLRHAALHDFTVLDEGFEYEERKRRAIHYLVAKEERLPATKKTMGPPLQARKDVARFKEKHRKAYERKGRLYALVKRPYRTIEQLLAALLKEAYATERAKRVRML